MAYIQFMNIQAKEFFRLLSYRLNPQLPEWAQQVVACTAEAMASVSPYGEDRLSLDKMANRPSASCGA